MPKGRMLNKKISKDLVVAQLSCKSALLYSWCIPHLDVEGRIEASPEIIKGVVVPYREDFSLKIIQQCVEEIARANNLVIYYGDKHKYLQFNGFMKNQKINKDKEAASEIPSPTPDKLQSNSGVTLGKDKLSKDKLREVNIVCGSEPHPYQQFEKEVLSLWNTFCQKHPQLSTLKAITDTRRKHLKSRYGEPDFRQFSDILVAIEEQKDFLIEGNPNGNHKNWKVNFDWLILNDTNYMKVLERKYKKVEELGYKKYLKKE